MHPEDAEAGPEGQQGTAGPVWVRPRFDEQTRERLKPVELVVQRHSRKRGRGSGPPEAGAGPARRVWIRVTARER